MRFSLYREKLKKLYEDEQLADELVETMKKEFAPFIRTQNHQRWLDEGDVVLITYGDTLSERNVPTLSTLKRFLDERVGNSISTVHILPMFPYTSDDGFSVVDYYSIHHKLGTWDDIAKLGEHYQLMFDAVVNHV